jgi:hypothetical protein
MSEEGTVLIIGSLVVGGLLFIKYHGATGVAVLAYVAIRILFLLAIIVIGIYCLMRLL